MGGVRCVDLAETANRAGTSVLLGRFRWFVRPALRLGIEYDNGEVSETVLGENAVPARGVVLRGSFFGRDRDLRGGLLCAAPDAMVRLSRDGKVVERCRI